MTWSRIVVVIFIVGSLAALYAAVPKTVETTDWQPEVINYNNELAAPDGVGGPYGANREDQSSVPDARSIERQEESAAGHVWQQQQPQQAWDEHSFDPTLVVFPVGVHPDAKPGRITKIVDGDTLHFDGVKYRLSLIDTPERGEDGFREATNALKELCPLGSLAYMDEDSITPFDKYGRHLGTVWCEGNGYLEDAGTWLHWNGHLEKFYTGYCGTTEAATLEWAQTTGVWTYHNACN